MAFGSLKARFSGKKGAADGAADRPESEAEGFIGPSPNPKTNLILADLALRGGAMLFRQAIERGLLGRKYAPDKAKKILKGRTMAQSLAGTVIARVATRSVPGAILVGGGLLAKTLYERRRAKRARLEGEAALEKMAEEGESQEA